MRVQLSADESPAIWRWLERLGLVIGLGVVIARATMLEVLRESPLPLPGQTATPLGAGPAASIVLSLLGCVPGLIVLLRRAIDPDYRLTHATMHVFMLLLAGWAVLSPMWASDRFAAIVGSITFLGAMALLWGMAQLVRGWGRFRLVVGVGLGLLLVFVAHGIYFQAVELPEIRQQWEDDAGGVRTSALRGRGLVEGELAAERFSQKFLAGELLGYTASPNSFAAIVVTLAIVVAGCTIQRLRDRQVLGAVLPVITLVIAGWIVWQAQSITALVTPVVAAGLFAVVAMARRWLTRHRKLIFSLSIAAVLLALLATVAHALYYDSLFHPSLTFRWRYWVASAAIFADHWQTGIGFANFGDYYLTYRLPVAVEEVTDPHNVFVRFFTELGLLGGMLAVAWEISRWWRMTRPTQPTEHHRPAAAPAGAAAVVVGVGMLFNIVASVDFAQDSHYVIWEIFQRCVMLALLLGGILVVLLRSLDQPVRDERPAPWMLYATIIATGIFMLHAMLDFVFFEAGPMYIFAMLTGAAIGLRSVEPDAVRVRLPRGVSIAMTVLAMGAWAIAVIGLSGRVLLAEESARRGDERLRAGRFDAAVTAYTNAAELAPSNADYALRAARALLHGNAPPQQVLPWLTTAVETDPHSASHYLERARYRLSYSEQIDAALQDLEQAVLLNPQEMSIRLEYAQALEQAGQPAAAAGQIEAVLRINDAYDPHEIERLSPERRTELETWARQLRMP